MAIRQGLQRGPTQPTEPENYEELPGLQSFSLCFVKGPYTSNSNIISLDYGPVWIWDILIQLEILMDVPSTLPVPQALKHG